MTLSLAILIALTSQQMASARALAYDAAGQVVLCTGHGLVTITVDRDGDPIESVRFCPDCVVSQLAPEPAQPQVDPTSVRMQRLAHTPVPQLKIWVAPRRSTARDPPVTV
ncbi:MAG: hypothetical protein AAFN94_13800 [Pseudomonadota bacterium]